MRLPIECDSVTWVRIKCDMEDLDNFKTCHGIYHVWDTAIPYAHNQKKMVIVARTKKQLDAEITNKDELEKYFAQEFTDSETCMQLFWEKYHSISSSQKGTIIWFVS